MQFTTITVACLSALVASVSAQNAAADAMKEGLTSTAAAVGALTTTSTTTSTTTRTVSYARTVTRNTAASASAALPTGGYVGSNSTAPEISSPAQPSASDVQPASYDSGAGVYVVSQALVAALGLGAVAFVGL